MGVPAMFCKCAEGAVDCIVVKVVVSEREEWFDDEKMLFAPPEYDDWGGD